MIGHHFGEFRRELQQQFLALLAVELPSDHHIAGLLSALVRLLSIESHAASNRLSPEPFPSRFVVLA